MATSSTSPVYKSFKYDVFLSFRGEDTRKNFVDHLYHALERKSIHTYKDDEKIKKGNNISDELIGSIEDSKFYIIVFSKNYASSSWCLDELVKIMECHRTTEHTAYPVFYDVEPSEVRKQSGAVAAAFAKHEKEESAGIWREALKEAANLAGWELKKTVDGHEAKFIQQLVEELSLELRDISSNIDKKLVGMESRIEEVVSSLKIVFDDVRMIGIKGMGGAGKTTLARAVFDHISFEFDGISFVENVREVSNASSSGLKLLQNQVLCDVLNDIHIKVSSVFDGKHMMKRMMSNKKVLLVLDDVDHIDQLEALAGEADWFKPGSKIIITTRDEQVLKAHRVEFIHDVTLLSDQEGICLFSRYAFGKEFPIQGYEELSNDAVQYAAGLPLTIKVLGSFLCGKDELEWVNALKRLETIPLAETLQKLELSYTSLEEDYKEMFLDIACIMKGWRKDMAIKALESCGFHARNGLKVLEQKSLITSEDRYVDMHDHLQELGRNIVRRSYPDKPHKHSRLWINNELEVILANDLGTKATRCIQFYNRNLNPHIAIKGLRKMKELKFLFLAFESHLRDLDFNNIAIPDFPDTLRYLCLEYYPFRSLPETFKADNLVALKMVDSRCVQLWEQGENKALNKLKFLYLSNSMLSSIDLGLVPNLETLYLEKCHNLVELGMSTGCLKLISIDISSSRLRTLDLGLAPNLETLSLYRCPDLVEVGMSTRCLNLKSVDIAYSGLTTLDLGLSLKLENLFIFQCHYLVEFGMPTRCLKLIDVSITSSRLRTLDLGLAPNLETLSLVEVHDLVELDTSTECLKLIFIVILGSRMRTLDLGLVPNLEDLYLYGCHDLVELDMSTGCLKLTSIEISGSRLRTLDLGLVPNLETLNIKECDNLVELDMSTGCLKLKSMKISGSRLKTLDLGLAPNLEVLSLAECHDLVELGMSTGCLKLKSITISGLRLRTFDLGLAPNIKDLFLADCYDLVELNMSTGCVKLLYINIGCARLRTLDVGLAPNLEALYLECPDLVELDMATRCLKLKTFSITASRLKSLDLGLAPNLERLSFKECHDLVELGMSSGCLKLISVSITITCSRLRTLDLRLAQNLKTLYIAECHYLVELGMPTRCLELISVSITGSRLRTLDLRLAPNLETLYLAECHDLVELGMPTECLKLLFVSITGSRLRTLDLWLAPNLEMLSLAECHDLIELNMADEYQKLEYLSISDLKLWILNLGPTPSIKKSHLKGCSNLVELDTSNGCLKMLANLDVGGSGFSFFLNFLFDNNCSIDDSFEAGSLAKSDLISKSEESCPLHPDNSLPMFQFNCFYGVERSSFTRNLEMLISIGMSAFIYYATFSACNCGLLRISKSRLEDYTQQMLEDLDRLECLEELTLSSETINHLLISICTLKHLKSLNLDLDRHLLLKNLQRLTLKLNFCLLLEKLPKELGRLGCLKKLDLSYTKIKHLPDRICMLKHLKSLELDHCSLLENLPEDLGLLECLEKLSLNKCKFLQDIPNGIGKMKCLKYFHLTHCIRVEKLPEEFGSLTCLKELDIKNTGISHLPQGILLLKDIHIIGSSGLVQSCDFTSEIQTPECRPSYIHLCYVL